MKRILFVFGTRPEVIKLAPLILELRKFPELYDVRICNTEQQKELSNQTLAYFGLNADYNLDCMKPNQTLLEVQARLLKALDEVYKAETFDATVVGQDSQTDLAVLKIEKDGLTAAEFADSDQAVVGEFVMAVGSPLGLDTTVTQGIISAVNRQVESDGVVYTCIQTDAAINSGNSGGALVNSDGQVIGINTLKLSGSGVEGIGFAIPINSTLDVIDQLIDHKKVLRPYIGITGINIDEELSKQENLEIGVYVKSVEDFSPAEKAGIKPGDVIIKADGKDVEDMDDLNEVKNSHQIGETMTLVVTRNGEERELTVTLEETP